MTVERAAPMADDADDVVEDEDEEETGTRGVMPPEVVEDADETAERRNGQRNETKIGL